jgi:uncharacterized protein (TIGR00106 family)
MRERRIVAEVSVVPLGTGSAGVSEYVADCIGILEGNKEVIYRMTPMGTIVEGTLSEVLSLTQQMHNVPFRKGAVRVITTLKIDDRIDKELTMEGKLKSVRMRKPEVKT